AVLVAHNALFDLGFLQRALIESGYEPFDGRVLDTLEFLRFLYPGLPSLSLGRASGMLGVEHMQHHRADSDAQATANVWLLCLERLRECALATLRRFIAVFGSSPAYEDVVWLLEHILQERELAEDGLTESAYLYRHFQLGVTDWTDEERESSEIDAQ